MDREAWHAAVHGVAQELDTTEWLNWTERLRWLDGITNSMDMSPSRSWWWTGKPGMLQPMVSQRVGHNWATELNWSCIQSLPWWLRSKEFACQCRRHNFNPWVKKIPWRRKWQPTPAFLPGKSYSHSCLVGCSPWGHERVGHDLATKQQNKSDIQGWLTLLHKEQDCMVPGPSPRPHHAFCVSTTLV